MAFQKVVFPSFWALHAEASVVLHSRTYHGASESGVSNFLGIARFAVKPPANQLLIYVCFCVLQRRTLHANIDSIWNLCCPRPRHTRTNCKHNKFAKRISNCLCFTVYLYLSIYLSLSLSIYIYIYIYIYTHTADLYFDTERAPPNKSCKNSYGNLSILSFHYNFRVLDWNKPFDHDPSLYLFY